MNNFLDMRVKENNILKIFKMQVYLWFVRIIGFAKYSQKCLCYIPVVGSTMLLSFIPWFLFVMLQRVYIHLIPPNVPRGNDGFRSPYVTLDEIHFRTFRIDLVVSTCLADNSRYFRFYSNLVHCNIFTYFGNIGLKFRKKRNKFQIIILV